MNKYIVIERGSRGFIEDVRVVSTESSIENFCNELYCNKLQELEEGEEMEEYLKQFGGISEEEDYWEVGWSEEGWYEVYKICK